MIIKSKKITPIQILICFIVLNLVIGIFIVQDFGRSTDEAHEYRTSGVALGLYSGDINENPVENYEALGHDRFYGTASTAAISFIENYIFPNKDHSRKVIAHYSYYIFFQAAIIGVFLLAKNFFDDWVSLIIAFVFGTQPLLFGHAFINPKDIPILTTFLFTVVSGFAMVDRWARIEDTQNFEPDSLNDQQTLKSKKTIKRVTFLLISLFLFLWSSSTITNIFLQLVEFSYNTRSQSLIGKIFASLTTSGSLEGYLLLARISAVKAIRIFCFGIPFILILIFYYAQRSKMGGGKIDFFMLLSASIWGFAVSTRVLAIAAGGLIGLYALIKFGRSVIFPLIFYSVTASMISFISWPLMWIFDLSAFLDSVSLYKNFPWPGMVLFNGQFFDPTALPASYLPKLMLLQFTEPLVILTGAGLIISLFALFNRATDSTKLLLVLAWFFLPLIYTIIWHPTMYSNFRHFLFITPPLFIFAGFAIQQLVIRIKNSILILSIIILLTLPGIIPIIQIHPFEYLYYNSFIGGIEGANNKFVLDYWGIAHKDAMDYANEYFPSGSRILIWNDNLAGKNYARKQFFFAAHTSVPEQDYPNFNYMIIPAKMLIGHPDFEEYPVVFSVDVDNVSLLKILEIQLNEN
ncbi:MAG: hypothetical protein ABFS17_03460 [Chloroflexota bacterium]